MSVDAWLLGLHLLSIHAQPGQQTITPGIYLQHESGATLGTLSNSEGRRSNYLGWTLQGQHGALTLGAITGYQRARVLPLVVPSMRFGPGRVALIPNPFGPWAVHLSIERKF